MTKPLPDTIPSRLLSSLYGSLVSLRNARYDRTPSASYQAARPVISIGGIHAGGTGKTPLTLLVGQLLDTAGVAVAFLSRGYGRRNKRPVMVRPGQTPSWQDIGDEPALLHRCLPHSWMMIGADRVAGACRICKEIPSRAALVLDDAFQHRRIRRDLDILCLPPDPFADRLIPAGTLREPLRSAQRAQLICLIGMEHDLPRLRENRQRLQDRFSHASFFTLIQQPQQWVNLRTGTILPQPPLRNPTLLSGIARPDRFIEIVTRQGIEPVRKIIFNDHHIFTFKDINYINKGSDGIVTTEKDAMRLLSIIGDSAVNVWYVPIRLVFVDHDVNRFNSLIMNVVHRDS